jgi:hypothetical protein
VDSSRHGVIRGSASVSAWKDGRKQQKPKNTTVGPLEKSETEALLTTRLVLQSIWMINILGVTTVFKVSVLNEYLSKTENVQVI